ncbi:transcriptional regulator LysR family [Janthinobacterium sp. HH01]|uniref:LysR family transcriptional regulator n=1 Tax=Janthinobacterium sp. HH01 TaxID=1198452 RepID=UPI0002AE8D96|nr:LysR family transcriptional regulator [Janthinobacterium sp. HH01]ELX09919.1 transcriptional regulator LysR family [Janthinobacterium sp. HH01]
MPRNLDIGLLRTLIQVADSGSMTAAASRLHMTQGAISQRIKRLEDLFGAALLERNQRGAGLTASGQRLLARARQLVALNDEIAATLAAPDGAARPVVRLGVPHDLIGTHLPPLLQEYARRHPQADVTLVAGSSLELRQACDSGRLDLALIEQPATGDGGGERLSLEQPVWVGAHGGTAWTRRPLPVCLVSPTCVFRRPVEEALAGAGIATRPTIDYASMEATSATVQADLAVTAWLASTVPSTLAILGPASGLPALPPFVIALHAAPDGAPAVLAMAGCARDMYAARCKS